VTAHRILLVGGAERLPTHQPILLEPDSGHPFLIENTRILQDALLKISQTGYDAVVCCAEQEEELVAVIRIRKDHPTLPILVLSSQESPEFQRKVRDAGATPFAKNTRHLEAIAEHIRLSVQSGELNRAIRAQIQRALEQVKELRLDREERSRVTPPPRRIIPNPSPTSGVPLLVEDDPNQALLMIRAFHKASVFAPLPILKSGEEAIAYLSGAPPFDQRDRFPLPSFGILDGHLPGKSGLEVLQWIRSTPHLRQMPVVMLSSSSDPRQINQAYQLGVNTYLVKPTHFDALVECVARIASQWGTNPPVHSGDLIPKALSDPHRLTLEDANDSGSSPRRASTGNRTTRRFIVPRSGDGVPEDRGLRPYPPRVPPPPVS